MTPWYKHYVVIDDWGIEHNCLSIRVPGRTVGSITISDGMVVKVSVFSNFKSDKYTKEVNDQLMKYVGQEISWNK